LIILVFKLFYIGSICYNFISGYKKALIEIIIYYIYFQIIAFTCIFYFKKILTIRPQSQKSCLILLNATHIIWTLVLLTLAIALAATLNSPEQNFDKGLTCSNNLFLPFQILVFLILVLYLIILKIIKTQIGNSFDTGSKLD